MNRPTDTPETDRTARLNVRLTDEERMMIRRAAKRRGESVSDFVRNVATEAAGKIRRPKA